MKQKTSKWILKTHLFRKDEYECRACGYRGPKPYAVCPECGARMTGTRYDASWVDEMEAADALLDD